MNVELTQQERDMLVQLLDAALREIGPEIRRTMTYDYKDELKEQRSAMRRLHERLANSGPNVFINEV